MDLSYRKDGFWVRFYPETPQGRDVWNALSDAGVIPCAWLNDTLKQLRLAGYIVKPTRKPNRKELAAVMAELAELGL